MCKRDLCDLNNFDQSEMNFVGSIISKFQKQKPHPKRENSLSDIHVVIAPKIIETKEKLYGDKENGSPSRLTKMNGSWSVPSDDPKEIEKRPPSKDICKICNKTVYFNEKIAMDDKVFHADCFRCKHCKVKITPANTGRLGDDYYCKAHYQSHLINDPGKILGKSKSKRNMHSFPKLHVPEPEKHPEEQQEPEVIVIEPPVDRTRHIEDLEKYMVDDEIMIKCDNYDDDDDFSNTFVQPEVIDQMIRYIQDLNCSYATVALDIVTSSPLGYDKLIPDIINFHLATLFRSSCLSEIGNNFRVLALLSSIQQSSDICLVEDFLRFLLDKNSHILTTLIKLFLHVPAIQELVIKALYGEGNTYKTEKEYIVHFILDLMFDQQQCYQATSFLERLFQLENFEHVLKSEETIKSLIEKMLSKKHVDSFECCFQYFSFLLNQGAYPKGIVSSLGVLVKILEDDATAAPIESFYGPVQHPVGLIRLTILDFLYSVISTVDSMEYEGVFLEHAIPVILFKMCCQYQNSNVLHSICFKIYSKLYEKQEYKLLEAFIKDLNSQSEISPEFKCYYESMKALK